jgi:hypothetical protein
VPQYGSPRRASPCKLVPSHGSLVRALCALSERVAHVCTSRSKLQSSALIVIDSPVLPPAMRRHRHPPTCPTKRFAPRHYVALQAAPVAAAGSSRGTSMISAATGVTSGLRQAPHTPPPRGPGLTSRSSRAPTAGHQARSVAFHILHSPGLPSHRRCRLSSNVRRRRSQLPRPPRLLARRATSAIIPP